MNIEFIKALAPKLFKIQNQSRIAFYTTFSDFTKAGTTTIEIFSSLIKRQREKNNSPYNIELHRLQSLAHAINKGQSLGDALKGWVPESERLLIATADRSGDLAKGLDRAVDLIDKTSKINGLLVGSVFQPILLLHAALGLMVLYGGYILPQYSNTVDFSRFTGHAGQFISVSTFCADHYLAIPIALYISIAVTLLTTDYVSGPVRNKFLDKLPPYSLIKISQTVAFMNSLSSMIDANATHLEAVSEISKMSSKWLKERTLPLISYMSGGDSLGYALDKTGHNFPDQKIIDLCIIQAGKSSFNRAFTDVTARWTTAKIIQVEKLSKTVNALGTLFVSLCAAWIVMGFQDFITQMTSMLGQAR